MKKLANLLIPFFLAVSSITFAECGGYSCGDVVVTRLVVRADGDISVGTSGDESLLTCDSGEKGYLTLDSQSANHAELYSLLLTAHTTEHPLWIRATDSGSCVINYIVSDV